MQIEPVYCAVGLWCTGGFAAGLARNKVPFSITIMKGFGVYDAGSP
jgi:hypothetical protein